MAIERQGRAPKGGSRRTPELPFDDLPGGEVPVEEDQVLDGGRPALVISAAAVSTDDRESRGPDLRKPHEMVVMMPRTKRVTLVGRLLYNAMLQVAQRGLEGQPQMPTAAHMFEAPLASLMRISGARESQREAAKRYLREMKSIEVDWESTAPGDGVKWRGFNLLSEVVLEQRRGENWVQWSYPPTLMLALRDPTRWSAVNMTLMGRLSTYAAIALYDICARYRDNPGGVTSRKPVDWWADALSTGPRGPESREWRKFKNERVKVAIREINEVTDLEVDLVEFKQGRVITEAQFTVRRKRSPRRELASDPVPPFDADLVLRAVKLGISEVKAERLVSSVAPSELRNGLDSLESRLRSSDLAEVINPYAWLLAVMRNERGSEQQEQAAAGVPIEKPGSESSGLPEPVRDGADPGIPAASPAPSEKSQKITRIKAEIAALDERVRTAWAERALDELRGRGLLTSSIERRAASGDVLHGMLGSFVVQLYALHTYGPAWEADETNS